MSTESDGVDDASRRRSGPSILVTHVYSKSNKGDAAILDVLLDQLEENFDDPKIDIVTSSPDEDGGFYRGYPLHKSFMQEVLDRPQTWRKGATALALTGGSFAAAGVRRLTGRPAGGPLRGDMKTLVDLYQNADLIVPVGGGYLGAKTSDFQGLADLSLHLHAVSLGRAMGKPVVLFSQSIGPFATRAQRALVRRVLSKATLTMVREDTSIRILDELGVPHEKVLRTVDAAFSMRTEGRPSRPKTAGLTVGITARRWLDPEGQARYEASLVEFIAEVAADPDTEVVLIPQVTAGDFEDDDRAVSQRLKAKLPQPNVTCLTDDFELDELLSVYRGLDLLVGTRFHSVIFALVNRVPAIAIEYEHKTSGILRDLDLQDWSIKMPEVTSDRLLELFRRVVADRQGYLDQLDARLPDYIERSKASGRAIAAAYAAAER